MSIRGERHTRTVFAACARIVLALPMACFAPGSISAPAFAQDAVAVTVAKVVAAEAPSQTPMGISVHPQGAIPKNAFLRVRGLPPTAALTEGYAIGPGSWAVGIAAVPNLKVIVPPGAEGRADVSIALVSIEGVVLAETQTALLIGRLPDAATGAPPAKMMRIAPLDSPPPKAAPPPRLTREDRERAQRLLKRGEDNLKDGNVAEALLFFEKAADAGLGEAALALGGTFEAVELEKLNIRGAFHDAAQARRWYERAAQLGATEAQQRLQRLGK